jgi:hypothetical protein
MVLMTIRITPDREGLSPFEKVFGRPYRMLQLGRLEQADVEVESRKVEHMRLFINQTRRFYAQQDNYRRRLHTRFNRETGWVWVQSLKKKDWK